MASNDHQSDEEAWSFAVKLARGAVLPMVLKSAIELDLLELIKKAGPNASVSASELASQLPTNNPDAASMIDRILRLLSAHSVLVCDLKALPDGSGVEWRYSLAPVCKFLTKNEDGVSLSHLSLSNHDKVVLEALFHLKDAVLEGGTPFEKAHGMNVFEYLSIDPRLNNIFSRSMSDPSTIFINKIVEIYRGFEGLKSLVDVGGGTGSTMYAIISKYPSIRGINFDLPHVIQEAPPYPGAGNDKFLMHFCELIRVYDPSIIVLVEPRISENRVDDIIRKLGFSSNARAEAQGFSGGVWLLWKEDRAQWICHDWSDEDCIKLLKKCHESLPENGKVIIADCIFPEEPNNGLEFSIVAQADMLMMAYSEGGKERTEKEFQALAKGAGFKKIVKVCSAFSMWIMELYK